MWCEDDRLRLYLKNNKFIDSVAWPLPEGLRRRYVYAGGNDCDHDFWQHSIILVIIFRSRIGQQLNCNGTMEELGWIKGKLRKGCVFRQQERYDTLEFARLQ